MGLDGEFAAAIEQGDRATALRLLTACPELVNGPGWTPPPLHCAVKWNRPEMVELLLDHGADIEQPDPDHRTTPLRYAIMYARTELVRLLAARGASCEPIRAGGLSAYSLAVEAARGAFAEFDDLPEPEAYQDIVRFLKQPKLD